MSGCGGIGQGCGCSTQPLPGGKLPADQTIEGGAQVRVTPAGFNKLTSILPALLNQQFGSGFCLGSGSALGADYCYQQQGQCNPGCNVHVHLNSLQTTVTTSQKLNLKIDTNADVSIPVDPPIFSACTLSVTADHLKADLDIAFDIDPTSGELGIHLDQINSVDLSGVNFSGCSVISFLANLVTDILDSFVGDFIIQALTPAIDSLVQGFLPHPLGIEGMVDVGSLLAQVSPGTEAEMEMRMVPGGYVQLKGGGMSLGMITGINSDWDTSTRTPDLDSEPALCVPPIAAPDFGAAPHNLPKSSRQNFMLNPAGEFLGSPDPASDLAIGVSQTTLDQFGHHAVASGAMCLGVGTSFVGQLNLGTIGLLVPSLSELGDPQAEGKDPLLLVTRPQKALTFDIGEGTDQSPALTIHIQDLEVDFYAFLYQRYVRAFTMSLTLDAGINLEFQQMQGQPATVTPHLVGLTSSNIHVKVLNSEFVRETPQNLEAVLPTVFDLALPLLGNALKPITVPSFAGFTLNDLRVQHVITSQDDFLAIYASLGASQMMRKVAEGNPLMDMAVKDLDRQVAQGGAPVEATTAKLMRIDTPAPEAIRAALVGGKDGGLPSVTLDVPAYDAQGRKLEYTWNLDGGLWRPFTQANPLVISDRAFAWQGKYHLGLRARVVGDYHTTDPVGTIVPITIDSAGPTIITDQVIVKDGKLHVPAYDIVSPTDKLQWAFGRVGDKTPWVDYQYSDELDEATFKDIAADGEYMVWVKDEAGNVTAKTLSAPFHGQPGTGGGCSCDTTGGATPGAGTIVLFMLVGAFMFRRRIVAAGRRGGRPLRGFFLWSSITIVTSLVPGCSCGSKPGTQACEMTSDCADQCPQGQVPICFDHECSCLDDVPMGHTGPYSDVDKASDGSVWVSAYSQELGDLVVAHHTNGGRIADTEWEWVDGVPAGPVTVPGSMIRGGVTDAGPDVGKYTSVAVGPQDVPEVVYQDVETGSLKFAAKFGGAWQIHTIDAGTGKIDPEAGGEITGLYNSIAVRTDDGKPGVAYMAEVSDGGGIVRAEVRYAVASSAQPASAGDWTVMVVDTITLPPIDPNKPDVYPLPEGLGLFIDATRDPATQAPVVVYYDRVNGDLKLAKVDPSSGVFTTPVVLDGSGNGVDVGWYPSVVVDAQSVVHVAYQSATKDDLLYINTKDNMPEVVDDGYRIVGQTPDGLPKPEFHLIGNDASLQITASGPVIAYQDSTSHELIVSVRKQSGQWQRTTIAGGDINWMGAYGFFAASVVSGTDLVISNWVVDQPNTDNWVEIMRQTITPQ
ncbi:MAG TPA: MYXO-CTERM sorting domain-containing protein [Kofleriaceae bacterium]|nr:MYXO-CTERM sorting domain-containing protein [Kofleriaceae bacterium]